MADNLTLPPPFPATEERRRGTTPREQDRRLEWTDRALVNLTMALRGLSANKLRACLTMLGIIIGVGAVIIAIAIGEGSRAAVAASIRKLGTNVLTVQPGQQRSGGVGYGLGSSIALKLQDAVAVRQSCPSVLRASGEMNHPAQILYKDKNTWTLVYGTSQYYPIISNHPVAQGHYVLQSDIDAGRRVAVLGSSITERLFGSEFPIGKTIHVQGQAFRVIGTLQYKGGQGWRNPDDGIYIPVTTAMRRVFGQKYIQVITCEARTDGLMERAQAEVEATVRRLHHLRDDQPDDFVIFNQADVAQAQNAQQDTFSALITYLAIVSLIVGGIGIMNIMLVSVTERTREIGVRKAIGAKRRDILTQFLLEALLLSLVGGLIGVIVGVGGSEWIQFQNGWTVIIAPVTVLMAFSFSALVGVFFGFYPAYKASNLNPIEALRHE